MWQDSLNTAQRERLLKSRRTSAVKPPIKRWIRVFTVRKRRLSPSLDILLCVSRSPTVTFTCTCAGPTTPTCLGRSTPRILLRVSSWALVSPHRDQSSHFDKVFCGFSVENSEVLILPSGNLGSKLVEYKEEMYITSDCGKTWRQVGHVFFLSSLVGTSLRSQCLRSSVRHPSGGFQQLLYSLRKLFTLWKWNP